MENHGTVVGGKTLQQTFARFETLEFCAKTEAQANSIGKVFSLDEKQINTFHEKSSHKSGEIKSALGSEVELILRADLIRILKRAYAQELIISSFGTFSVRLGEDAFLITPTARDRFYMRREDLVRVEKGQWKKDKNPSRSTGVHRQIYLDHPEVNCIMFAQSPYATAYAIAHQQIDTRTIPESYIILRELPLVPYGSQYGDGKSLSRVLSPQTPIILIENDSILVTGDSLISTFDRLEVAEFSARSLTLARQLGKLQPIGDAEITELKEKFRLGDKALEE
jgi:L-fuculose-phosphate aldolase